MKLLFLSKSFLLNIMFIGLTISSYSQNFSPDIENYSIEDYQADNQNWGIDVDENGVVYIANNKGLLRYNGQSWKLLKLPKKTIIRSVFCDGDKIFTGSYEEFGFWKANHYGIYEYTSLTTLFDVNHEFKSEEFWQIIKYNGDIVFRSFGGIYVLNGDRISYVKDSENISQMALYQDKLIVSSLEQKLRELKEGELILYKLDDVVDALISVNNMAVHGDKLFLFDLNHGGYIYESNTLYSFSKEINFLLQKSIINKTVFIDDVNFAFGTIKEGIVIYNYKTNYIQHIDKAAGLQNNTVLGLSYYNGNLWGALDNGICKFDIESPYQYYHDLTGVLGTVYDMAYFNSKYYLASNTGVYSFTNNKLELIENSEGHAWDLSIVNNQLFCGHNKGTFYIENNTLKLTNILAGGVYSYIETPNAELTYLQGNYSGIGKLTYYEDKWIVEQIEGLTFPVNKIVFESDYVIWVTHPYKGVYRIKLNKNYTKALKVFNYSNNKNFKEYKTDVFKMDHEILFYNSNEWFFNNSDSIEVYKNYKDLQNKIMIGSEARGRWFIDRKDNKSLLYLNKDYIEEFITAIPSNKQHLVAKYEKVVEKNDSIRMINLNDGFAVFNINSLRDKVYDQTNGPLIEKIYSKHKNFSIEDPALDISYKDAKYLSFEIYSPNRYQEDHVYILSGKVEQKEVFKDGKFTLQNLRFGDYTLSIQTDDANTTDIIFTVLPPWYLSNIMLVVYVLLVIGMGYVIYRINNLKIRKEKLSTKKKYIRETQKRISKLEKENLEKEVNRKKKELTNTTETIIKKNETIILLRNELNRLLNVSPNQTRTKNLINLSKNKKDVNEDWKAFEANFNELHKDFFQLLIKQYPKLTTKDLKLCAYIKSGLLSKEIAPLMDISLRGVELHRYRLRKKLSINSTENLINFFRMF